MPLSASGKTDRKRLQFLVSEMTMNELSSFRSNKTTQFKPLSSKMEKRIQSLWEVVFKPSTQISVDDNFFRLGGDSMTAMQLVSMARKEGINMTVDQIFRAPVLSDLALMSKVDKSLLKIVDIPPFSLIVGLDCNKICNEAVL